MVNTFGDLRGTFAAIERINSVLSGTEIDESLAYGLERELHKREGYSGNLELFYNDESTEKNVALNEHYMSALKSSSNGCGIAWNGDICLEGILDLVSSIS